MGVMLRQHGRLIGRGQFRVRRYIIDDPDEPGQNSSPWAVPSGNPSDMVHGTLYTLSDPWAVLPGFDEDEGCSVS